MNKGTNSNQSVGKALQIIEVLSESNAPMRLQDISKALEMPASTVFRMIAPLMEYGYVQQASDTSRYYLTLKFAKIGSIISSRISVRSVAQPFLLELSDKCKEATCIVIENNMEAVYVDVVDGPDGMLKIMHHIGKQAPMHCTGAGKCLLLNYDMQMLDSLIAKKGLERFTPNTITTKKALIEELDTIRANGYAVDDQECEIGARCVAVGIRDYKKKIVAAISVSGPVNRMTNEYISTISGIVIKTANKISEILAYSEQ